MPDRNHVSRLYIHGSLSWPRRSADLGRSGLFWIVLGRPAAGRSGKSWGALVLVRPGAVWGRPNLTLQKAVYAAYRVCADAHLGVLGRFGAFWSGAFWGALRRPGAFWGVPKRPGTAPRRSGIVLRRRSMASWAEAPKTRKACVIFVRFYRYFGSRRAQEDTPGQAQPTAGT